MVYYASHTVEILWFNTLLKCLELIECSFVYAMKTIGGNHGRHFALHSAIGDIMSPIANIYMIRTLPYIRIKINCQTF